MLIIRKPRSMRSSDTVMNFYLDIAKHYTDLANLPIVTVEEKYEILKNATQCLKKAARSGGFFSVRGMQAWLERPNEN